MIDRFDVVSCMTVFLSGRYVLYEDHLAEIEAHAAALTDSLLAEIHRLDKDLALNASMLARQCDLARDAETEAKRLRNALVEKDREIERMDDNHIKDLIISAKLQDDNYRLRKAVKGALNISELWLRPHAPEEFEGEAAALNAMKQHFEEAMREKP